MPIGSAREGQSECPEELRSRLRSKHRAWLRTNQLRALGYKSYSAYLRSPHWMDLRRRYFESERPQECMCGETVVQLHHLTYDRIGAEQLTDLVALCASCHADIHTLERRGEISLDFTGLESPERAETYREHAAPARARADKAAKDRVTHRARRQYADQLRRVVRWAEQADVDIRPYLDRVEQALNEAEEHIRQARTR